MLIMALISRVRTRGTESPDNFPEVTQLVHFRARSPLAQVRAPYLWAALPLRTSSPMGKSARKDKGMLQHFSPRLHILGSVEGNWAGEGEGEGVGHGHPYSPRVAPGLSHRRAGKPLRSSPAHCTCWRPGDVPSFPEEGNRDVHPGAQAGRSQQLLGHSHPPCAALN